MLEINNNTVFPHAIIPFNWPDDIQRFTLIVKATYQIENDRCKHAEQQLPVLYADELDESQQSIKFANDIAPFKPKTDVALIGHAVSTNGTRVKQMRVRLRVDKLSKTLLVTGDRQWKIPLLLVGWNQSSAQAFSRMELSYLRTFGGIDDTAPGYCMENPTGIGYLSKKSKKEIADSAIPNIEYETDRMDSPKSKIKPAGFGFIDPAWKPRTQYLGTYDEEWDKTRKPLLAKDFSMSYFNSAPSDMQIFPFLRGGELVELDGFRSEGLLRFNLPVADFNASIVDKNGKRNALPMNLDTICFLTDESKLYMVWRTVVDPTIISTIEKIEIENS